jgi:hypothetical protein
LGTIGWARAQFFSPSGGDGERLVEAAAGRSFEDEFGFALQGSASEGGPLLKAIYDIVVEPTNQDICQVVFLLTEC